jgi:DNA-binding NarL/FixJ family response regulator
VVVKARDPGALANIPPNLRPGRQVQRVMSGEGRRIGVMIVTDHPIVKLALRSLVEKEPDLELRCEARCETEALREYQARQPDLTVVDLDLPGGGGWMAVRLVRELSPHAPIIVLISGASARVPADLDQSSLVLVSKSAPSCEIVRTARAMSLPV